ncbi:MAG: hypothetical protein WC858_06310 [Parcubacteria group bacterium]|jgi:hypothetical protein
MKTSNPFQINFKNILIIFIFAAVLFGGAVLYSLKVENEIHAPIQNERVFASYAQPSYPDPEPLNLTLSN